MGIGSAIGGLWRRTALRQQVVRGHPLEVRWRMGERPALVYARAGRPIRIVIRRTDANPSTESVCFPDFGILAMLSPSGSTVVDLGPRDAGRYEFCSPDGEIRGCLIVEP